MLKTIFIVLINMFLQAVCMAQISGQPVPTAPVSGGVEIDPVPFTALGLIQQAQSPTLDAIFCGETDDSLLILELTGSPVEYVPSEYDGGDIGIATWTTYTTVDYNWIEEFSLGNIDVDQLLSLLNEGRIAKLLIGSLDAQCGSAIMIAIYMSWTDEQGNVQHALIPVLEVSQSIYEVYDVLLEYSPLGVEQFTDTADCDVCDFGCCHQRYRGRLSDALGDFGQEMKSQVPPIGGAAVGCFVLCAKWIASPPLYATCAASCTAGVALGGAINANTASNSLDFRVETAKQSYCLCIDFKLTHCAESEVDLVGCGGGSQ